MIPLMIGLRRRKWSLLNLFCTAFLGVIVLFAIMGLIAIGGVVIHDHMNNNSSSTAKLVAGTSGNDVAAGTTGNNVAATTNSAGTAAETSPTSTSIGTFQSINLIGTRSSLFNPLYNSTGPGTAFSVQNGGIDLGNGGVSANGPFTCETDNGIYMPVDERDCSLVQPLSTSDCLQRILAIQPSKFFNKQRELVGFTSQNIGAVMAEAIRIASVPGGHPDTQYLNMMALMPYMVGAVQAISARQDILDAAT